MDSNKKPRKRIKRFKPQDNIKKSSTLRRIWAEQGYCVQAVRLHLQHLEFKGEKINI